MTTNNANIEATLLEVLENWAMGDVVRFNTIRRVFPVDDLRVADVFDRGTSLKLMEDILQQHTSLNGTEKLYCDAFIAACRRWSEPDYVRPISLAGGNPLFDSDISPSDYAKFWFESQEDMTKAIMCLRPSNCSWINIRIMHPVFSEITKAIMEGDPLPRDFVLATRLTQVMSPHYANEAKRRDATNMVLNECLFRHILNRDVQVTGIGDYETDGSAKSFGITVEYKVEKAAGKGSDPYMQNIAYYGKYWASEDDTDGSKKHCCPWLMVEILGQEMGIAGAAYACGRICAQPISANVPFLAVPSDKDMALTQARLCMALRIGATRLRDFYENDTKKLAVSPQARFPYPRFASFDGADSAEVEFEYISVWGGIRERKMLFEARRIDTGEKIMVKFTSAYDPEVHLALASVGLAPKMYDIRFETGLVMVVMEYMEDARVWTDEDGNDPAKAKQLKQVQEVLVSRLFVHGDLRPPNVLVVQNSKVCVVDFDWAGKAGKAIYPVHLNPRATWHPDAKLGEPILPQHDEYLIEHLLGRKRKSNAVEDSTDAAGGH
jgi:Phosphotransferase enzyme family